ncbi:MAG TPA: class I SAM-dependent methyltransferase [Terriglobales bacterium]|nr:class I SAM-dependent methyltransferase [Terriglobales bacterium]
MEPLIARVRRSLLLRGWRRTLRLGARWVGFHLRHGRRPAPPGFDLEFGLDTDAAGDVAGERKGSVAGVEYGPVDVEHFAGLMRQVDVSSGEFVFLDFGCGRGRALLLASLYPFRQIRGVEYDRELQQSAERHLAAWGRRGWLATFCRGRSRWSLGGRASIPGAGRRLGLGASPRCRQQRCFDLGTVWEDATAWEFPVAPSVFYFNEPLGEAELRVVAARIRRSLAAAPRPAYVLYLGDWGAPVWEEGGDFELLYRYDDRSAYRWGARRP